MLCIRKYNLKSAIAGFLLSIFILVTINSLLFIHLHTLPDGTVIVHAHPFNKKDANTPQKQHQHSNSDFFVLSHTHTSFIFHTIDWIQSVYSCRYTFFIVRNEVFTSLLLNNFYLRGPPVYSNPLLTLTVKTVYN